MISLTFILVYKCDQSETYVAFVHRDPKRYGALKSWTAEILAQYSRLYCNVYSNYYKKPKKERGENSIAIVLHTEINNQWAFRTFHYELLCYSPRAYPRLQGEIVYLACKTWDVVRWKRNEPKPFGPYERKHVIGLPDGRNWRYTSSIMQYAKTYSKLISLDLHWNAFGVLYFPLWIPQISFAGVYHKSKAFY